jgi:hypothetical protein
MSVQSWKDRLGNMSKVEMSYRVKHAGYALQKWLLWPTIVLLLLGQMALMGTVLAQEGAAQNAQPLADLYMYVSLAWIAAMAVYIAGSTNAAIWKLREGSY